MSGKTSLLVCVSFIKVEGEKNKKGEVKSEDMRKKTHVFVSCAVDAS